jgi:hypothetical protein
MTDVVIHAIPYYLQLSYGKLGRWFGVIKGSIFRTKIAYKNNSNNTHQPWRLPLSEIFEKPAKNTQMQAITAS